MKICVLGAGAYGLALALAFYRNNNEVTVWTKIEQEKEEITVTRQNKKALPGVFIPNEIQITTDLSDVQNSNLVVLAIPISFFRNTCLEIQKHFKDDCIFCIATKGIENETGAFCHEILTSIIPNHSFAILSGPTFAIDLATNSCCGLTLATDSNISYEIIEKSLQNGNLIIERSRDLLGTELCGAVKNIMAIMSGMLDGMKTTETTKALFLTKAIQEINDLVVNFGGLYQTVMSFAGVGDLLLTCNSTKSRNYSLGVLLATAKKKEINDYISTNTVEGYLTLASIYSLLQKKRLSSPLIELLYDIIFHEKDKKELLTTLTSK